MPKWMDSARDFLGLGEDPYYDDDYDLIDEDVLEDPVETPDPPARTRARPARVAEPEPADWDEGDGGVRMIRTAPGEHDPVPAAPAPRSAAFPDSDRGVVRPLPGSAKPEVVSPTRFDDVQSVADAFKKVQPVIINLQGVDRDLSRRLIDFASGLCYGLEGEMERVADQVFLLTPRGAEVSADDRRRLSEGQLDEYAT
ncbi:MAG: cell division protein SepF [Microthrixaceae bacterium]|nr:cell division protein SepF [Microthrixaceae bacterium]MCB1010861.1 cell division protein SepF [Microthrixaceae bacterium]MCO5321426.1 cell division protein SepF [Microthrixaceae bacterium]